MTTLDKEFWNSKYRNNDTGWDLGKVSPPIKDFLDKLENKALRILIPGCGNAYEGEYAHRLGFKNVFLADIAPLALENFAKRVPDFPTAHLLHEDFFAMNEKYDLIIEQTFFCAIHPQLRGDYVKKAWSLLNDGGKIVGLLFNDTLNQDAPPFGGSKTEYENRFSPLFHIRKMETASHSIKPRAGRELWVELEKINV